MTYMSSPKENKMIHYCKSFRYGGQGALDKRFYRSNEVSVPIENGSNISIMGFSLTSPYNGLFKSSPSGLFTNKFLRVILNNKIIFINRKEAYAFPNSSTKATNNKIGHQQQNRSNTLKNHNMPSLKQFRSCNI
jgi:hypothetical protein